MPQEDRNGQLAGCTLQCSVWVRNGEEGQQTVPHWTFASNSNCPSSVFGIAVETTEWPIMKQTYSLAQENLFLLLNGGMALYLF